MTRRVEVILPEMVWGRLATIADKRGVKVADLIGDAIFDVIGGDPQVRPPLDGSTGAPGRRLDVLDAAVKGARLGGYRAPRYGTKRGATK